MLFTEPYLLVGYYTNDRNTDKGEVGGSGPPRPTIQSVNTPLFSLFSFLEPAPKKRLAKNLPKVPVA
jgi:hypothetical protein